jgi:hypothetical protein
MTIIYHKQKKSATVKVYLTIALPDSDTTTGFHALTSCRLHLSQSATTNRIIPQIQIALMYASIKTIRIRYSAMLATSGSLDSSGSINQIAIAVKWCEHREQ